MIIVYPKKSSEITCHPHLLDSGYMIFLVFSPDWTNIIPHRDFWKHKQVISEITEGAKGYFHNSHVLQKHEGFEESYAWENLITTPDYVPSFISKTKHPRVLWHQSMLHISLFISMEIEC